MNSTENIEKLLNEKLFIQYGKLSVEIIENLKKNRLTTLRVNPIKSNCEEVESFFKLNNITFEKVDYFSLAYILKNVDEKYIYNTDLFKNGKIYLQSLSSMLPALMLNPCKGEDVLDMTSAPGGKTSLMASNQPACNIIACENNKIRCEKMSHNLLLQGVKNVSVWNSDATKIEDYYKFDKILLDAPCSGSGTLDLANEKQCGYFSEKLVQNSSAIQKKLLNKAINILKKDCVMVYSTCSILKEENEDVVNSVLNTQKVIVEPYDEELFASVPKLPTLIQGALCVKPTDLYEGFFAVKLKKIKN